MVTLLCMVGCGVVLASIVIGAVRVPISEVVDTLIKNIAHIEKPGLNVMHEAIIFSVRLPRVLVTCLVGSALAVSGVAIQSVFRNPMADPGIIGISSGSAFGAVVAIYTGVIAHSILVLPLFAIVGALSAAAIIFSMGNRNGKVQSLRLILSGLAVSTFIRAITSLILTSMREEEMRAYLFWSIGSLSDRRWVHVQLIVVPIVISMVLLLRTWRQLNVLLLGDEEAQALGLNPTKARKKILAITSVTTALAVCVSGSISFVGLIVPHVVRMVFGPDNKYLMPISMIAGATFLLFCDLIARTIIAPVEIGVGIVTAIIGAPYFIYLLRKTGQWEAF